METLCQEKEVYLMQGRGCLADREGPEGRDSRAYKPENPSGEYGHTGQDSHPGGTASTFWIGVVKTRNVSGGTVVLGKVTGVCVIGAVNCLCGWFLLLCLWESFSG